MNEANQRSDDNFDVSVEWAPAYELVVAYTSFVGSRMHPLLELGNAWVRRLRQRLPADFTARTRQLDELVEGRAGKVSTRTCSGSWCTSAPASAIPRRSWTGSAS